MQINSIKNIKFGSTFTSKIMLKINAKHKQ